MFGGVKIPTDKRQISHHSAQTEWNALKKNEELVKEKIEEYLEIYNRSGAAGLPEVEPKPKPKKAKKKKSTKRTLSDVSDDEMNNVEKSIPITLPSTLRPGPNGTSNQAASYTPYSKHQKTKAPAQELALRELNDINERIASLVQVKNMGLSTADNAKQLKKLVQARKKKAQELKRLQSKQRASNKYRDKRKKKVEQLCESNPDLAKELGKIYRGQVGRPPIEDQCPDLLSIIEEIAKVGGASDDRRRSETIRPCLTLDDLREKIKQRGYDIKRTTLYYRLLPHRASSIDGRRHVRTVPVRLRRAQNDEHGKHEDGHFATATIRYIKDLAGIFGNNCIFFLSQDDKCKVPIGLPAAKIQAPMLMHLDYAVRLPDHDWTVAPRHQLTPSVYAACMLGAEGEVGYSGPTYIAVRSAKHDRSDAQSHAKDFDTLVRLKEFEKVARDHNGDVKPIVIITVDGGPDENPRFPKTLIAAIRKFRKYNLDALFILTHAPGQSAYNVVERRMAPLSHDLAGLILPHDHYGSHLNDSGVTINQELEKANFKKAGEVLAEVWSGSIIDEYPVIAEYMEPPATTEEEKRQVDITMVMDSLLRTICAEEEAEEGHEFRIHASDEYYQEKCRVRAQYHADDDDTKSNFRGEYPKYDIDEYWCATHVLQTQYTIQIIRCNNPICCGVWRSNYIQVFPHRFLPPPVPFERTPRGIQMAEKDYQKGKYKIVFYRVTVLYNLFNFIPGQFYGSLFQRIQFHGIVINHTKNDMLPFDFCCSSVKKEIKKRICTICKQYIPSASRMKQHYKIHQQYDQEYEEDDLNDLIAQSEAIELRDGPEATTNGNGSGAVVFNDMLDWLKSDFDELDLQTKEGAVSIQRNSQTTQSRASKMSSNSREKIEKVELNDEAEEEGQEDEVDEDDWTYLQL
ncbi:unnamed protein product [Didymodactylos carnosus]|uniref:C2H2-type domain-containing protein n=1 Tax=Didymodactylos carnosus TaxID=1234261 RepID=A0A814E8D0_9BILA|nr:unnamed protein product [Didymodactylos carnosus]CAF3739597.1 unnamed protein product [Didymodactylos carnosus]